MIRTHTHTARFQKVNDIHVSCFDVSCETNFTNEREKKRIIPFNTRVQQTIIHPCLLFEIYFAVTNKSL